MDWNAIKTEYITDETTSYQTLADKYGCSKHTISERARAEGWVQERTQYLHDIYTKAKGNAEKAAVRKTVKLSKVADKLLDKLIILIDSANDPDSLKKLTGAAKDIKELKGEISPIERREQEARIKKLEKEIAGDGDGAKTVTVNLLGDLGKYAN